MMIVKSFPGEHQGIWESGPGSAHGESSLPTRNDQWANIVVKGMAFGVCSPRVSLLCHYFTMWTLPNYWTFWAVVFLSVKQELIVRASLDFVLKCKIKLIHVKKVFSTAWDIEYALGYVIGGFFTVVFISSEDQNLPFCSRDSQLSSMKSPLLTSKFHILLLEFVLFKCLTKRTIKDEWQMNSMMPFSESVFCYSLNQGPANWPVFVNKVLFEHRHTYSFASGYFHTPEMGTVWAT